MIIQRASGVTAGARGTIDPVQVPSAGFDGCGKPRRHGRRTTMTSEGGGQELVVVGVDGVARDIRVVPVNGMGLDEKAIEAMKSAR